MSVISRIIPNTILTNNGVVVKANVSGVSYNSSFGEFLNGQLDSLRSYALRGGVFGSYFGWSDDAFAANGKVLTSDSLQGVTFSRASVSGTVELSNGTTGTYTENEFAYVYNAGINMGVLISGPETELNLSLNFASGDYSLGETKYDAFTNLDGASFTRSGARAAQAADGSLTLFESGVPRILPGEGLKVSAGSVNKCEVPSAPVNLTGVSKGGDAAATLTLVDDSFELAAAGLAGITGGKAYKLDNSAGSSSAFAPVSGAVGNTNAHTVSLYLRCVGTVDVYVSGAFSEAGRVVDSASYVRTVNANQAPSSTTNILQIRALPGTVVYFVLPQLEEGSTASDYIPGDGDGSSSAGADEAVIDLGLQWALKGAVTALDVGAYGAGSVAEATVLDDDFSGYADQAAAVAAGYTFSTATFDAVNNQIDFGGGGSETVTVNAATIGLVDGVTYVIEWGQSGRTTGFLFLQYPTGTNVEFNSADGAYAYVFTHATGQNIRFSGASYNGSIDSITIRRAIPDRSGSGNAAIINGTLTAAEVASGSDLLALSGFSASNYLELPYSSDLDFGTGDFAVVAWVRRSAPFQSVFEFAQHTGSAFSGAAVLFYCNNGKPLLRITDDGYLTADSAQGPNNLPINQWEMMVGVRRGSQLEMWVGGSLVASTTITNATGALTNASAELRIGTRVFGGDGGVPQTLPRIIKGRAPTAREIEVLYAYERSLFEADATLPGWAVYPGAQAWDNCGGLNPQEGFTVVVDYEPGVFVGPGGHRIIGQAGPYNPSILSVSGTYNVESWNGVSVVRTLQATESTPRRRKVAFRWDGQNRSLSLDGSVPVSATGDPQVGDKLYLGKPATVTSPTNPALNGTIYSVFITTPKSDAELVTLSGGSV